MSEEPNAPSRPKRARETVPFLAKPDSAASVGEALADPFQQERIRRVLDDQLAWSELRRRETRRLFATFYIINGGVLGFVFIIWATESVLAIYHPGNAPRIVTDRVVLALIAASAAQLGVLAAAVGRALLRPHDRP